MDLRKNTFTSETNTEAEGRSVFYGRIFLCIELVVQSAAHGPNVALRPIFVGPQAFCLIGYSLPGIVIFTVRLFDLHI